MEKQQKTMKAIVLEQTKKFVYKDMPIPKPQSGQVLVKIMAAPINPSDLAFLAGHYQSNKKFPTVPGFEGAGEVVENGGGLMGWNLVGKRVAAFGFKSQTGSYSQYAIVDATNCITLNQNQTYQQGSMSFVNPITAVSFLEITKDGKHKAVIHTAAASALGRMLNRLFIAQKIPIINVVRRQQQVDLLKKQGAQYVLNTQNEDFDESLKKLAKELGANLCFDAIGGEMTGRILKNMPKFSKVQVYGALSGSPNLANVNAGDLLFGNKIIKGFHVQAYTQSKGIVSLIFLLNKMTKLLKTQLKTQISKEYQLSQLEQAIDYYRKNMTKGKVIIKPWPKQTKTVQEKKPE